MSGAPLVRAATGHDLWGLMSVKPGEALHRERLEGQENGAWTYLVAVESHGQGAVCGFVLLLWGGDEHHVGYPVLADLLVRESRRGQGVGSRLIARAEWLCRERGLPHLGLSVSPGGNPRAHALYLRLGYLPTPAPPHCDTYYVTDEQGRFHFHEDWCIALAKDLMQE